MNQKARIWWIAGLAVVVIVIVVLVVVNMRGKAPGQAAAPQLAPTPVPVAAPPETGIPAGVTLSASDRFVRQVVAGLSSRPALVEWLAYKDLIRRFVAAVALVAQGKSPVSQISFLRPRKKFRVRRAGGHLNAAPSSFRRYDMA
ncbi:MAG: DUF3014 domain-containing protein, partial [Nitrospiraceae bacterium]|nr:DUF3014 domain-containing protein [Nitrospiraceae bacterium]